MKKYSSDAGLPSGKQHFHALKHSIGTHILDAGEDIYFAKDWLGHKNIQNTIIYARFSTGTRDARARTVFSSNRVVGCPGSHSKVIRKLHDTATGYLYLWSFRFGSEPPEGDILYIEVGVFRYSSKDENEHS